MDAFDNMLGDSQRAVPASAVAAFVRRDDEDIRLMLEQIADAIDTQAPEFGNFRWREMPRGERGCRAQYGL
jgi:hypothetical protein